MEIQMAVFMACYHLAVEELYKKNVLSVVSEINTRP